MEYATLIEQAKKGRTAAKLADDIGVSKSLLTDVIKGEKPCPEWVAAKLAEEAGVNPVVVVFENLKAKAKTEDQRGVWQRLLEQTARALTVAVALSLWSFPPSKPLRTEGYEKASGLYIMLRRVEEGVFWSAALTRTTEVVEGVAPR